MLGTFFKRVINAAALVLVALTFFLVPIGKKTAFQHAIAIFTSRPAQEAGASLADASHRAAAQVEAEVKKVIAARPPARQAPPPP